jgi:hypothetical protein
MDVVKAAAILVVKPAAHVDCCGMRPFWRADPLTFQVFGCSDKASLESGKCISGADIQALWHAWNAGEIPDPADGDEVVQPKSRRCP